MTRRNKSSPKTLEVNITKADVSGNTGIATGASEPEDEFDQFYDVVGAGAGEARILKPPEPPKTLQYWVSHNNTLGPCVSAMEVNIDGTGWDIRAKDGDTNEDDALFKKLTAFFGEPWPSISFITMRRKLRRDLESVGFGFLEVMRNVEGEIVFLRHAYSRNLRLIRLGDPVDVEVELDRGDEKFTATVQMRERRFVQLVGPNRRKVFFREFGTSRDLDRHSGKWAEGGEKLDVSKRATELIYFTVTMSSASPYGIPRWMGQSPSVKGSRGAEEFNVTFFDRGGVPPFMVFIQGGRMAEKSRQALEEYFKQTAKSKHAPVAFEVYGAGGNVNEREASVRVTVERFDSARQADAMFLEYDKRCEQHVRKAFRLPPLFIGLAEDYSFATAFASYTVAEAQVFKPERDEFDEVINNTIMRELDPEREYVYESKGLTTSSIETKLKALDLVIDKLDTEEGVRVVNDLTGMSIEAPETDDDAGAEGAGGDVLPFPTLQSAPGAGQPPQGQQGGGDGVPGGQQLVTKSDNLVDLADAVVRVVSMKRGPERTSEMLKVAARMQGLGDEDLRHLKTFVAINLFGDPTSDLQGLGDLAGCALVAATHMGDSG